MIQRRPSTCISSGEGGAAVLAHGLQQRAVVAGGVRRAHRVQGALAARRVIDVDSFCHAPARRGASNFSVCVCVSMCDCRKTVATLQGYSSEYLRFGSVGSNRMPDAGFDSTPEAT
jgi:hypothetical protein